MTKKEPNEQEQRLLSHASLDELIKMKMEEELKAEFEKSKEIPKIQVITDISKVPKELIFSKKAVYKIFNRINKTETYLNGLQAEAMLGVQNAIREKIRLGQMDAFSTDTAYVKFEKIEV
jgi:hypothetical protein